MASSVAVAGSDVVVLRDDRYRVGDSETEIPGWRGNSGDVAVAGGKMIVVGEGRYRVGWGADAPWLAIPDWQPGAVAADVADLDGDGRPELLVRSGSQSTVGWGPWTEHPGVGAAIASPRELVRLDATGRARTAPLTLDVDKASEKGVTRARWTARAGTRR